MGPFLEIGRVNVDEFFKKKMKNINIIIKDTITTDIHNQWLKLWKLSASAHFFNHPSWINFCREIYSIKQIKIVAAYINGQLVGVLPLAKSSIGGKELYTGFGGEFLDRSNLLVHDLSSKLITYKLIESASGLGYLYLTEVDSVLIPSQLSSDNRYVVKPAADCLVLPLSSTDNPFRNLNRHMYNKLRNRIAKYQGQLRYENYRENLNRILPELIHIDQHSTKRTKGIDTFSDPVALNYYRKLLSYFPNNISIDILYFDNTPFVYNIGVLYKKVYMAVNTAYLPDYSFLQPGRILLIYLLDYLQEHNYLVLDFSRGVDVMKLDFANVFRKHSDVYYLNNYLLKNILTQVGTVAMAIKSNTYFYSLYCRLRKFARPSVRSVS